MDNLQLLSDVLDKKRVIHLYTVKDGISPGLLSQLTHVGQPYFNWVDSPAAADYFVFPTNYEVAHDTDFYAKHSAAYAVHDKEMAVQHAATLTALSKQFNKKILIVYFSDSADEIKADNAIIFRTSIEKSKSQPGEHAMPVIKVNLLNAAHDHPEFLEWKPVPSIGFRGIAVPFPFHKFTRTVRNKANLLANRFRMNDVFNLRKNYGYLERRNALEILKKNKDIGCDFSITGEKDSDDENSRELYIDNVFGHPYTLCAAGFGNYSYRFYETLSAGRIPVFIDTDCKLPFEEFIHWKSHVVWVDRKDIYRIDKILTHFHHANKSNFRAIQQSNKELFRKFLSPQNYFTCIKLYL